MTVNVLTVNDSFAKQTLELQPTNTGGSVPAQVVDAATIPTTLTPLSDVLYVDPGTTVPTADQNGSIGTPFKTAAQGLAAVPNNGTLIFTPGYDLSAEGTIDATKRTNWLVATEPTSTDLGIDSLHVTSTAFHLNNTVVTHGTVVDALKVLTANNCVLFGPVTGNGSLVLKTVVCADTIACSGIDATNSTITQNITISNTRASFVDCLFGGVTVITFSGSAGTVTMDAESYASWLQLGSNTVVNGTIVVRAAIPVLLSPLDAAGFPITNFQNAASSADLALGADGLQSFPAFTFTGSNKLAASSKFLVELAVEVGIYKDSDHGVVGQVDFTLQLALSTDGSSTVTTTLNTAVVPNISYLPAGLAGASASLIASANGFTVQAQRPAGTACHAYYYVTWQRVRNVT